MSDERTDGEKASVLAKIESAIRGEGYSSISELIGKLHDVQADLTKAEKARDKFSKANEEAAKIIGTKGGELGALNQEIKDLKSSITDLESQLEEKGETPVKPVATTTTEKTTAEQLSEVEANLTDEQRELANKLLEAETDNDKATEMVKNPAVRLKFLKDLSTDPTNKQRPKSFFEPKKDAEKTSGDGLSDYERLLAQMKSRPTGPSGKTITRGTRTNLPERKRGTLVK